MRKLVLTVLVCLALIASAELVDTRPAFGLAEEEISGCFSKGETADSFVLTDKDTGEETQVKGPEAFGNHAGHEVKLTGEMVETDGEKVFHATEMKHVAGSCTVAGR